jgi:hypothetical protein
LNPGVAYGVREVLPSGVYQTTINPPALAFTRGERFLGIDFGNYSGPRRDWHGAAGSTIVNLWSEPGDGGSLTESWLIHSDQRT